jgi:tetratricopeptide (TPR) repeat protein
METVWTTLLSWPVFLAGSVLVILLAWRTMRRGEAASPLPLKLAASIVLLHGTVLFVWSIQGVGERGGIVGQFGQAVLTVGSSATCGLMLAIIWGSDLGALPAKLLGSLYDGGSQQVPRRAAYSIAEAKCKRGRYEEAIAEIQRQLSEFPGDLTGTLLLAEIQAGHLHDLASAVDTLETLIQNRAQPPGDVAVALNRLADLHLRYAFDPEAARTALERIAQRFPDSEPAHLAAQRLAHLTSPEMLAERHEPHRVRLDHYEQHLGLLEGPPGVHSPIEDPDALTAAYVKHLEQFPADNETRERLAVLYAQHYRRLDLAAEQLEELITQPHAPTRQVVRWLNLLADLQTRYGHDLTAARQTLERAIQRFPRSAAAEAAQWRLAHLPQTPRAESQSPVLRPGFREDHNAGEGGATAS